jgi:hypothetical protein
LIVDCDNTFDEIHEHLKEKAKTYNLKLSDEEIKQKAEYWFQTPNALENYLRKTQVDELKQKGIACFSTSDKILLMWSHYADSHKGACLTFDISKDEGFFAFPFIVDYPKEYPRVNFIREKDKRKRYKHMVATKSTEWEYEKEIRILKDTRDHGISRGNIKFNKESLVEIKFGLKTNPKDIETIMKIIAGQGYKHVKLYQGHLVNSDFGINFERLN